VFSTSFRERHVHDVIRLGAVWLPPPLGEGWGGGVGLTSLKALFDPPPSPLPQPSPSGGGSLLFPPTCWWSEKQFLGATTATCKGAGGQARARFEGAEERKTRGRARKRASCSDSSALFDHSEQSERREFADGPRV